MRRVLAHYFDRRSPEYEGWLDEHANIIAGMVAADASEVQVAAYLRSIEREMSSGSEVASGARPAAIAVWHIAKAALVRDFAERVLRGEVPVNTPTADTFSHWIASRLLTEEELARFEQDEDRREGRDGAGLLP